MDTLIRNVILEYYSTQLSKLWRSAAFSQIGNSTKHRSGLVIIPASKFWKCPNISSNIVTVYQTDQYYKLLFPLSPLESAHRCNWPNNRHGGVKLKQLGLVRVAPKLLVGVLRRREAEDACSSPALGAVHRTNFSWRASPDGHKL